MTMASPEPGGSSILAPRPYPFHEIGSRVPARYDCHEMARVAEREGVGVFPGWGYFASNPPGNYLRLCFATCIESKIDEGVRRLGEIVKRLHNEPGKPASEPAPHNHFD